MRFLATVVIGIGLTGCAMTPLTPMQQHLNRYAGTQLVANHCGRQAGGYRDVKQLQQDGIEELEKARALGATEKDLGEAEMRVGTVFVTGSALIGEHQTCSALLSKLAS